MKPNRVGAFLDKNMPDILIGVGIVLNGAAVAEGIRNTPKALDKIRAAEEEKGGEKLTPEELFSTVWRCYISTAASMILGDACIIGGSVSYRKRNAGLLALCGLGESTIRLYQDKLIEAVGAEKAEEIENSITEKQLEEKVKNEKNTKNASQQRLLADKSHSYDEGEDKRYIFPSDIAVPCYDSWSGRIFYSRKADIDSAVNECNATINSSDEISLNDFYYMLGMEPIDLGYEYGWNSDKMLDISYGDKEINGIHYISIRFRNRPTKLV